MTKILLVCAMGMSTSLLVTKMNAYALSIQEEVEIQALPFSEMDSLIDSVDVVMLGPQVRYQKASVDNIVQGRIPVLIIDMRDYGTMNGKAVLEAALNSIKSLSQ